MLPNVLCAASSSPVHSAHVGQELEVHYRWHPYFRCKVFVRRVEQRATGQFLQVEWPTGIIISIAGWMLDAVACGTACGHDHTQPRPSTIYRHLRITRYSFRSPKLSRAEIRRAHFGGIADGYIHLEGGHERPLGREGRLDLDGRNGHAPAGLYNHGD
jgi:hypothetical protein